MFKALGLVLLIWAVFGSPLRHSTPQSAYKTSLEATASTSLSFKDRYNDIPSWLQANLDRLGLSSPTLVQQQALPAIFDGKDVILQAQTGSGKTLAYSLPVISKIDASRAAIQAVIVVPTRELGLQVAAVLKQLVTGSPEKIMVMTLVEGSKNRRQQLWATAEPPHVVVGNPRSLQRIVDMGRLRLNSVNFVVLDEVDACLISPDTRAELHKLLSRQLSNSYQSVESVLEDEAPEMQENLVFTNLAKDNRELNAAREMYRSSRQTILCSATIPQRQHFASSCLKNGWTETLPELIHVSAAELVPKQVRHEVIECTLDQRAALMRYLVTKELASWDKDQVALAAGLVDSFGDRMDGHMTTTVSTSDGETTTTKLGKDGKEHEQGEQGGLRPFQMLVFVDALSQEGIDAAIAAANSALKKAAATGGGRVVGKVDYLSEDMSLDDRAETLSEFRKGDCSVLLCSGIAARGLDVPNISHVVMFSLPDTADEYLHRAGRAGRLGRTGKVISFTSKEQGFVVSRLSNELGVEIHKRLVKLKEQK